MKKKTQREIWMPLIGYEGSYMISSHGRVKRLAYTVRENGSMYDLPTRFCTATFTRNCYSVSVGRANERRQLSLARLMLRTFVGEPEGKCAVKYKDGNPRNVELSNLSWATLFEFRKAVYEKQTEFKKRKEKEIIIPKKSAYCIPVVAKHKVTGTMRGFCSISETAAEFGFDRKYLQNKLRSHHLSGQAHNKDYIFKIDDGSPWPPFSNDPGAYLMNKEEAIRKNNVKLTHHVNKQNTLFFDQIGPAAQFLKVKAATLRKYLTLNERRKKPLVIGEWIAEFALPARTMKLSSETIAV